eukprot:g1541.t1
MGITHKHFNPDGHRAQQASLPGETDAEFARRLHNQEYTASITAGQLDSTRTGLKEGNMVIFKDKQTNLVYVAEITYVEQDTETMGVHYYLHDVKAKETFSLDTALRDRKNFAPEYCRTQRTGKRTREFSIPTFNPRQGDEAVQMDIKYTAYEILAVGFEMEKGTKPGRKNIPERVVKDIEQFHSAAASSRHGHAPPNPLPSGRKRRRQD